jgi:hypothetical protein
VKFLINLFFCLFSFGVYSVAMNSEFDSKFNYVSSVTRNYDYKDLGQVNKFHIVKVATNKVVNKNTAQLEDLTITMDLWFDLIQSFFIPLTIIWGFSCGFRY